MRPPVLPKAVELNGKYRALKGWKRSLPDHRDRKFTAPFKLFPLPRKVDCRPLCGIIEDQGDLGSCTANAATSAMEFLYKRANKPILNLSRLFVYYFTRYLEGTPADEDAGAMNRTVMKSLACYGACDELLWPYDVSKFSVLPSDEAQANGETHQILSYYRLEDLSSIRRCLSEGYSVIGGFSVPSSITNTATSTTGEVFYPQPDEMIVGGHAINFVGYDDNKKLLLFQNSWGEGWGDKGFGYLPYKYVENGLADDFWTIRKEEF